MAAHSSSLRILSFPAEGLVVIEGNLDRSQADELACFASPGTKGPLILQLDDVDVLDGPAAAALVGVIRRLAEEGESLVVRGAPQVIAHNVYRIGLLNGGGVRLEGTREDEAYG